ncbi:MAG: hypothetical protein HQL52_20065 [Magnetococcales bacterium]|nr:hypothetical protein [Magnetococcales bacterium]
MDLDLQLCELPDSLQQMVELIGYPATLGVLDLYGGITLPVLTRADEEHPLAKKIGLEAVKQLAGYYGSERPTIPRAAKAIRCARDREIHELYSRGGTTVEEIARKFELTGRAVTKILGRPLAEPSRQMAFDFGSD